MQRLSLGRALKQAAALLVIAVLPAACGTAPHRPDPRSSTAPDPYHALLAASRDLGPAPADQPVSLLLLLRDGSAQRRAADLQALYDPRSPRFGQYETPDELAQRYGPDPPLAAQAQSVLQGAGLTADWQRGQGWMTVAGPAAKVEALFGVTINNYVSRSGVAFYASTDAPRLPASLNGSITETSVISSYPVARPAQRVAAIRPKGLTPDDLMEVYDIAPLRDRGIDGTGETVVLWSIGTDDEFKQSDFDRFVAEFNNQKYRMSPLQVKVIGPASTKIEGEIEMDIEVIHEIAPGANIILYTTAPASDAQEPSFIQQMLKDNPTAIFSNSWGLCELQKGKALVTAESQAYDQADQAGQTVFFASGDTGAFDCLTEDDGTTPPSANGITVDAPCSVPGVTCVGGTRVSTDKDGHWYNETAWEMPTTTNGTGGGISAYFPIPSWQNAPGVKNQYSNGKRQLPDVAADADPDSGIAIYSDGAEQEGGGTSQSAPIWAGITALMNQYLKKQGLKPVGFLNPALYTLASTSQQFPPFHDITAGSNLAYPTQPGWDNVTGLGSPDVWNLVQDLEAYQRKGGH